MRNFQADVTISTRCGHARHEVVYRVSAWGHVFRVFSPCELMPKKLGCASLGACACQVAHVRTLLQGAALPSDAKPWFDPLVNQLDAGLDARGELNTFIANVQANAREIIDSQLIDTSEVGLIRCMRSGPATSQWAAAVVASQLPKLSPKLVRALRSLYSTTFAGTRAVVLMKLSELRDRDSRAAVLESLPDPLICVPVRDAMVRRYLQLSDDAAIDKVVCETEIPIYSNRTIRWTELRDATHLRPRITKLSFGS